MFAGGLYKYHIEIYRNSGLIGGKSFEEIIIPFFVQDENDNIINTSAEAPKELLRQWLAKEESVYSINTYELSIKLLPALYETLSLET